jgi:helix-turn-helix protein
MRLQHGEVQAAYYAVAGFIRQCNLGGRRPPPEVEHVFRRFDSHVRLSRGRHESGCAADDESLSEDETWIGSPEAAEILAWSKRQVQRHANELCGRIIGGRWLFRESDVIDYMEGLRADGPTSPRS